MKALKLLAAALVLSAASMLLVPANAALAQQTAPVNQPAAVGTLRIIDVDQPLPKQIDVQRGEVLVFVRNQPIVGTDVTVSQRQMACFACITMRPVNLFAPPKGYGMIMAVSSQVTGFTFFDVTHQPVTPSGPVHLETIKVVVH